MRTLCESCKESIISELSDFAIFRGIAYSLERIENDTWLETRSPTPVGAEADTCPDCGNRAVIAYQGQGRFECLKCEGNGQV